MKYFTVLWCRHEVCELKKTFCRNVLSKNVYSTMITRYIYRERERERERGRERERERFILALKILPLKKWELLKM